MFDYVHVGEDIKSPNPNPKLDELVKATDNTESAFHFEPRTTFIFNQK